MVENNKYQIMQLGIEERKFGIEKRKLKLLEQELTIKFEKLKAEAACKRLSVSKEQLQLKVDILQQRAQLNIEGVPQDEINSALPVPEHSHSKT